MKTCEALVKGAAIWLNDFCHIVRCVKLSFSQIGDDSDAKLLADSLLSPPN
jgi:hypothetical protein